MKSAAPIRTCIGCRERADKTELLRIVLVDGEIMPDQSAERLGRGAYVHPMRECVTLARERRAYARAFRVSPGSAADDRALQSEVDRPDGDEMSAE